jgi:hypothetical protein
MVGPSNMAVIAIGFTYAQQMLYPVLFQTSGLDLCSRNGSLFVLGGWLIF